MSRQQRPLDAILIQSFPSPPTHIPPTPTTPNAPNAPGAPNNPPPSRPPSAPLPPIPGPSRISGHDPFHLLSSGRRSSNVSVMSLDAQRPSLTASSTRLSLGNRPPSTVSPPRSPTSLSHNAPSIAFSITESDHLSIDDLTRMSISPMPPLSDNDDDGDDLHRLASSLSSKRPTSPSDPFLPPTLPSSPSTSRRRARGHHANESISSIDMRDLLENVEEDNEDHTEIIPDLIGPKPRSEPKHRPSQLSIADPIDPQTLHLQFRASRSRSESHKQMLRSRSKTKLDLEGHPGDPPTTPLPELPHKVATPSTAMSVVPPTPPNPNSGRSSSPDISAILSTTPRPLRRVTGASMPTRNRTLSRPDSNNSFPTFRSRVTSLSESTFPDPEMNRRASEGFTPNTRENRILRRSDPTSFQLSDYAYTNSNHDDNDDARSWIEHDEFGRRVDGDTYRKSLSTDSDRKSFGTDDGDDRRDSYLEQIHAKEQRERELERQLEGGGSDSDSSLDLHTPLPHLMLRQGLLSPRSKLLAEGNARPDSVASIVSANSTSGLAKDSRDTPMRRIRHRDGRLLRGGIGLTTGLGWSDSEDEDAPSPLTRRISLLNLSRRSSTSSMHSSYSNSRPHSSRPSSRVHPLSRSYSSGTLVEGRLNFDDNDDKVDEFGRHDTTSGQWSSSSLPHVKQRKDPHNQQPRISKSISSSSSTGSRSSLPPTAWQKRQGGKPKGGGSGRTSTSSASSHFSLDVSIPEHEQEYDEHTTTVATRTPRSVAQPSSPRMIHRSNSRNDDIVNTPSTASTLSIPLPATPHDDYSSSDFLSDAAHKVDKDKSLPPLPPSLRRSPASSSNLGMKTKLEIRPRTQSSASSASQNLQHRNAVVTSSPSLPTSAISKGSLMATPKPLKLPQSHIIQRDRPAVPVPSISHINGGTISRSPFSPPLLTTPRSVSGGPGGVSANSNSNSTSNRPMALLPPDDGDNSLSTPGTPGSVYKPKPRTGTGMVYRTSGSSPASRMRLPSTTRSTSTIGSGSRVAPIATL